MRKPHRQLAIACCLIVAACGSSSPTTPSVPTAPQALTIKGIVALSVSQTSQLAAVLASGQDVASGATWISSDSSVARVSATGLLTAIAAGSATIRASFQTAAGMTTVTVSPVLLSSTITTCGNIVNPGNYAVAADLSQLAVFGVCLQVQTSAVQIDCKGHMISGIQLSGVNGISIANCGRGTLVSVDKSTNVTIAHSALLGLYLTNGSGNLVLENTFDGGYDGSRNPVGQDDGIVFGDETNDVIEGNIIRNVFDAGIEGVDAITNSKIVNNTIVNAGVAGIASYWCTSWIGNTISGNSVSNSERLARFLYDVGQGKCLNLSTSGAFVNNQFIGNRFTNPVGFIDGMFFGFSNLPGGPVLGNLLQSNDLGATAGPFTDPASGFIDGGGNICAQGTSPYCGSAVAFRLGPWRSPASARLGSRRARSVN